MHVRTYARTCVYTRSGPGPGGLVFYLGAVRNEGAGGGGVLGRVFDLDPGNLAYHALEVCLGKHAIEELGKLLKDGDPRVREVAAAALSKVVTARLCTTHNANRSSRQ